MNESFRFFNKKRLINNTVKSNEENRPNLEACKSVDLDEIFQFSAARQRALERNAKIEYEQRLKNFMPNRVFINHVDSFNGRIIAEFLSEQTVDVFKPEQSAEDENSEEGTNTLELSDIEEDFRKEKEVQKERGTLQNFDIIGTVDFMKSPDYLRPEGISEILYEEAKEDFLSKLLTCGFIIYDISSTLSCHPLQIEEANWVLDNIVYHLDDIQRQAPKQFKKYKDCRTFILISTLMTWGRTKPIDPDDPSLPFTERDYRKRKPHPNYKVHCDFEKRVLEIGKKFPQNLRTIVIGSGITYGHEEDVLHFLFKMAWLNNPHLLLLKPGSNKIPLIHVSTLANIVHNVIKDFPSSLKYIIAVEQSPTTLKKIVKLISKKLGSGKYIKVSKEEAFVYPEIKQRNYDMLTVNLNIIPGYIINHMELIKKSELTFAEKIDDIIAEFRESRNLRIKTKNADTICLTSKIEKALLLRQPYLYPMKLPEWMDQKDWWDRTTSHPCFNLYNATFEKVLERSLHLPGNSVIPIKIFIHGPPASGKSTLSKRLSDYYKIHHLHVKEVIEKGVKKLRDQIEEIKNKEKVETRNKIREAEFSEKIGEKSDEEEEEEQDSDDDDEGSEDLEILTQLLNDIEDSMGSNERGRLDEHLVLRLFKKSMLSNPCQNQGYVIDGYPRTLEDTKVLYEPDEEIEEVEEDDEKVNDITRFYNRKIMPDFVGSLDASDEFLIQKVIKMPESQVQNSHYVEEEMCRRLVQFRSQNTEENTPLIFYDELDVPPRIYNIEDNNDDLELNFTFKDIVRQIGPPRNYAPPPSELLQKVEKDRISKKYLDEIAMKSRRMMAERREKMENWMFLKNQEKEMEEKALAILAMPLRHYLMKYIFPTLTRGLVEVARIRPQDPVDYLAEYLFKENPEGKMFHPNYDNLEEELAHAMKDYEVSLDGQDHDNGGDIPKSFSEDESIIPDAISNVADIKTKCSAASLSSKRILETSKEFASDSGAGASSGSCKCVPASSRKSSKSSSTSSSSTPPIPYSMCTCPPYSSSGSSDFKTSSSTGSESTCSKNLPPTCKCPH